MSDIVQTPASVAFQNPSTVVQRNSNAAITIGQVVVADASFNFGPASAGSSQVLSGTQGVGIALSSTAGANQPFDMWTSGTINLGATLQIGQLYVLSKNGSGAISPYSDLIAGNYVTFLGVAVTAALLYSPGGPIVSGIAHF